jgi:biopolymer transport protein ExbD
MPSDAPQKTPELAQEYQKKVRKQARRADDSGGLNINSMMDIMTILLVFLLVTITSDPLNVKQDDYLKLAKSTADYNPEDSIPIIITKEQVVVDNKRVVKVDCSRGGQICQTADYRLDGNSYAIDKSFKQDGSADSFLIDPLHKRLDALVKAQKEEAKELGEKYRFKPIATIVCDRDIPYRLIAEVVHTAGMAGLSDLRFAIMKTTNR